MATKDNVSKQPFRREFVFNPYNNRYKKEKLMTSEMFRLTGGEDIVIDPEDFDTQDYKNILQIRENDNEINITHFKRILDKRNERSDS